MGESLRKSKGTQERNPVGRPKKGTKVIKRRNKTVKIKVTSELAKKWVGRPKAFTAPDQIIELFQRYLKNNDKDYKKRKKLSPNTKPYPLTIQGFCNDALISKTTFDDYAKKPEFSGVCNYIRNFISDKIVCNAMIGEYHANFTQWYLERAHRDEYAPTDKALVNINIGHITDDDTIDVTNAKDVYSKMINQG